MPWHEAPTPLDRAPLTGERVMLALPRLAWWRGTPEREDR
jgi:hypothetical protein